MKLVELMDEIQKGKRVSRESKLSEGIYLEKLSDTSSEQFTIDVKYSLHLAINNGGTCSDGRSCPTYLNNDYSEDDWIVVPDEMFKNNIIKNKCKGNSMS